MLSSSPDTMTFEVFGRPRILERRRKEKYVNFVKTFPCLFHVLVEDVDCYFGMGEGHIDLSRRTIPGKSTFCFFFWYLYFTHDIHTLPTTFSCTLFCKVNVCISLASSSLSPPLLCRLCELNLVLLGFIIIQCLHKVTTFIRIRIK